MSLWNYEWKASDDSIEKRKRITCAWILIICDIHDHEDRWRMHNITMKQVRPHHRFTISNLIAFPSVQANFFLDKFQVWILKVVFMVCVVLPGLHMWRESSFPLQIIPVQIMNILEVLLELFQIFLPCIAILHILDIPENQYVGSTQVMLG